MKQSSNYISVPETKTSDFCKRLEYKGDVFNESDKWHIWGTSPIDGPDGKVHVFVARWPLATGHGGWETHSEIAHAVSDKPEGPFKFVDVVIKGKGGDVWNAQAPHNPNIHKIGDKYALFYIARTTGGTPKNQRIGLLVSSSLYGPWEEVGSEPILSPSSDPNDWDYMSPVGVNNPAFLMNPDGKYRLYYKAIRTEGGVRRMGLAVADKLEGPYKRLQEPVASVGTEIEDGFAFMENGKYYLLTTDNHGFIKRGAGLIFSSTDGINFNEVKMGYDTLAGYEGSGVIQEPGHGIPDKLSKFERPQLLMRNGKPAYLYVASGKNFSYEDGKIIDTKRGSSSYVLKVN